MHNIADATISLFAGLPDFQSHPRVHRGPQDGGGVQRQHRHREQQEQHELEHLRGLHPGAQPGGGHGRQPDERPEQTKPKPDGNVSNHGCLWMTATTTNASKLDENSHILIAAAKPRRAQVLIFSAIITLVHAFCVQATLMQRFFHCMKIQFLGRKRDEKM